MGVGSHNHRPSPPPAPFGTTTTQNGGYSTQFSRRGWLMILLPNCSFLVAQGTPFPIHFLSGRLCRAAISRLCAFRFSGVAGINNATRLWVGVVVCGTSVSTKAWSQAGSKLRWQLPRVSMYSTGHSSPAVSLVPNGPALRDSTRSRHCRSFTDDGGGIQS